MTTYEAMIVAISFAALIVAVIGVCVSVIIATTREK